MFHVTDTIPRSSPNCKIVNQMTSEYTLVLSPRSCRKLSHFNRNAFTSIKEERLWLQQMIRR